MTFLPQSPLPTISALSTAINTLWRQHIRFYSTFNASIESQRREIIDLQHCSNRSNCNNDYNKQKTIDGES